MCVTSAQTRSFVPTDLNGTGLVMGQVIDAVTAKPVPGATVTIESMPTMSTPGMRQSVRADNQGRFVFKDLPAGVVYIDASKAGYLASALATRLRSPQRSLTLAAGEKRGGFEVRLTPASSISGTVYDDTGAAVAGIAVALLQRTPAGGHVDVEACRHRCDG